MSTRVPAAPAPGAAPPQRIELGDLLPGIDRIEIHCDEADVRSAAVPRRLGYRLDRIEPSEVRAPAETGRRMFWVRDSRSGES